MTFRAIRSPLSWLGGLLVVYLVVPVAAFGIRFGRSGNRGFGTPGLWSALRVSIVSASVATLLIALLGIPLAYVLAHSRSRVSALVSVAVQLPLALPPLMGGILLIYLVGPYTTIGRLFPGRITGTVTGIVLAQAFVSAPFLVIAARSAFAALDPALEEVAATLGHRPLSRFWRVSLPGAAPGITAGLLLAWLRAFGEYGATVLLSYHPYSLPVYTEVQFSGSGLATTQAPTFLALVAAGAAVAISRLRAPRLRRQPRRRAGRAPRPEGADPQGPGLHQPTSVAFDLDVTVGSFHLDIAHLATSGQLAIVGPSGSGKSLTLRALAGLLGPEAGSVSYGGEAVGGLPAEERGIGYVPQGFGLFPGRTVWEQLTFATDADPRLAAWWLSILHLDGLETRLPEQLSGGQRQRVSLARALSRNPRLVLLDEPFSSLDAPVREELRRELRRLQRDVGLSTVLVTHDPEEAALLADEIIVITDGRVVQAGPRRDVYARPASPLVAQLLGVQNLCTGRTLDATRIVAGDAAIETARHGLMPGIEVRWCIRPERVELADAGRYPAELRDVADLGAVTSVVVRLAGGAELRLRTARPVELAVGSACRVDLDPDAITVWASTPAPAPDSAPDPSPDSAPDPDPAPDPSRSLRRTPPL